MLPTILASAGHLARRRLQHAALQWAASSGGAVRAQSSLPPHTVMGMPSLSPTMDKGNIAEWKVKEGDTIAPGTVLADIETDKATIAFESQDDGVIAKLLKPAGASNIPVGEPLLVVVEDAEAVPAFKNFSPSGAAAAAPPSGAASKDQPKDQPKPSQPAAAAAAAAPAQPPAAAEKPKVVANHRIGPAARMLMAEAGLAMDDITPTGPNNIITKGDVMAAMEARKSGQAPAPAAAEAAAPQPAQPAAAAAAPAAPAAPKQPTAAAQPASSSSAAHTDIPTTQIRRVIAQRLVESKVTIPALYACTDVALDALVGLRKALADQGVKLSVNDFILKAVALALKEVPRANCLWDAKRMEAVPAPGVDICVAVATDRGLLTPIVKNADQKSITQISADVRELAARAKANKLKPEEFQGGSFTVSNLGMYGVTHFSAIINPPQGAILAVGTTQQVTRLVGGKPVASSVMTATLSVDNRMYEDGELLGQVLGAFKKHMEAPVNMML